MGRLQTAGLNRRLYAAEAGVSTTRLPDATHPMWRAGVPEGNVLVADSEGGETPRLTFSAAGEARDYVFEDSVRGQNLSQSGAWLIFTDEAGNAYVHIADEYPPLVGSAA